MFGTVTRLALALALIGSASLLGASRAQADHEVSGPVAYWSMDLDTIDGVTLRDQSGHGHDGIIVNAVPAPGRRGEALLFSGASNQYVVVPDAPGLDLDSDFTLAAWIFMQNYGAFYRGAVISKLDVTAPAGYSLHVSDEWNFDGLLFYGLTEQSGMYSDEGVVQTHEWKHVAISYGAGLATFYVDGLPAGHRTELHDPRVCGANLYIGNASWQASGFGGRIDELRIYDRALSAAEVLVLHAGAEACAIHLDVAADGLSWQSADVETFDVMRGDLGALLAHGGDFGAEPVECLASQIETPFLPVVDAPAGNGAAHWYLVRGRTEWGACTADSMGQGQVQGRDALEQAPGVCP